MTITEALPEYDPNLPTFEVWLDGRRLASTQIPGRAFKLIRTMRDGRPSRTPPELRVVDDRRVRGERDTLVS